VYDNELRTPAAEDAVTLPEVMTAITDAVFTELSTDLDGNTFTDRQPMISSLRRNLQSAMTNRLVALSSGTGRMPRPIRTLSLHHLRQVQGQIDKLLEKRDTGQIDSYTLAHLEDLQERIKKALDSVYVEQI
jgi:hypothetical protein